MEIEVPPKNSEEPVTTQKQLQGQKQNGFTMDDEAEYTKMLNEDLIKEKEVKSLLKDANAQEELKVQGNPTNVAEKEAGNQVNKEDQKENNSAGGNGG